MTSDPSTSGGNVNKSDLARGAGLVALSRLGAVIEVVAQPAYIWMFGIAVYGVYTVFWSAVRILTQFVNLAMNTALQRVVPQAETDDEANAAVKMALLAGVLPSVIIAAIAMIFAPALGSLINAGPELTAKMTSAVRIFAPALPLWAFIDIATAAVRARRAFGPEVRLRLFWEQIVRLIAGFCLYLAGWSALALVTAHVVSLAVTSALALRLLFRYYSAKGLWHAAFDAKIARALFTTGLGLLPAGAIQRIFIDLPPLVLNALIPGSGGAVAAGLFGVARKIATVPQLVQQVFMYVLAPLASAQAAIDRAAIAPLYAYAARLSTIAVLPLALFIILLGGQILRLFSPEAAAALPILIILVIGRAIEAAIGPASPVLEMIGHKILPTVNGLAGLAIGAVLALVLVPRYGGEGMAIAVTCGVVVRALLAVIELKISDGFQPFDGLFARALGAAIICAALLLATDQLVNDLADLAHIIIITISTLAAIWAGFRWGLPASDRMAFGAGGRKLGLTPVTPSS